jgi:hypothetical protein
MPYTYDIFISYGQLDDQDPAGETKGWVDLLVERLPRLVSNNLGYQPRIWRDERSLTGNALLTAAIEEGLAHSLLFIPILSPRYVQSVWCRRELDTFSATPSPPGVAAHRSRIFKVIKSPLLFNLGEKEPPLLRELIGYPFYEMESDMPVEFGPEVHPNKDPRYWGALRRLAWDISNMLVALKDGATSTATPDSAADGNGTKDSTKYVYLAEATSDLTQERELVRDELRHRGYEVLPDQKLPIEEGKQTEAAVRAALERSILSVHLIGMRYGSTPEDDPRSVVCIQEALAAQRCVDNPAFSRLLWMPQRVEISDERQKTFVVQLQDRISAGAELLQTSIEDLKAQILQELNPPAKSQVQRGPRPKIKQVYLICESRDRSLVRPIKDYLFDQKLEVITRLDGDEGGTLMDYHRKNLRECDAALVYFGNGDEPWVRRNLEDLEKAYGYGRENDWGASAVYVGAPANSQKDDFHTIRVPIVIKNYNSFDPNELRAFVSALQAVEGGQR